MFGNCLRGYCLGVERSWREGLAGFYIAIFIMIINNIKQTLRWDWKSLPCEVKVSFWGLDRTNDHVGWGFRWP